MKVFVQHEGYGCDTGCCGHVVSFDLEPGEKAPCGLLDATGFFIFGHPDWSEDRRAWAEELIREECGPEHVADLDWEQCRVVCD